MLRITVSDFIYLICAEAPDAVTTADWSEAQQLTSPNDKDFSILYKTDELYYSPSPNDKEVKMGN